MPLGTPPALRGKGKAEQKRGRELQDEQEARRREKAAALKAAAQTYSVDQWVGKIGKSGKSEKK